MGTAVSNLAPGRPVVESAKQFYTQVRHSRFNPSGQEHTEDCGPTCLAMAVATLSPPSRPKRLPNGQLVEKVQDRIDSARFTMFSDLAGVPTTPEKAGFHPSQDGQWSHRPGARQTLTNLSDLECGARNHQLITRRLRLRDLWLCPDPLILSGDPSRPEAYGARCGIDYRGGHFIFMPNGIRPTKQHTAYDPLSLRGPLVLSRRELMAFLSAEIFGADLGLSFALPQ